jgi:hypothetical protein
MATTPPPDDRPPVDRPGDSPPPGPPPAPTPESLPPLDRVRRAAGERASTDYVFTNAAWNVVLGLLTCGIYLLVLLYQLMKRDRDHNRRRLDLLNAMNDDAWARAYAAGAADELRPLFDENATALASLRNLTMEFRDPALWVVISIFASTLAEIVGYIFIDMDLDRHDRAEVTLETNLATIYARLGIAIPTADPARVKGKQDYPGRIVASIFTCGIYVLWWTYDMQVEGNRHLAENAAWEDVVIGALPAA